MSDIPSGTNRTPQNPTEDLLKELNKSILLLNTKMNGQTEIFKNMFLASGGKPDAAKNIFKLQESFYQRQEIKDKLDKKFGEDWEMMLKYVKEMSTDIKLQTKNKQVNKEVGKNVQQNIDKNFIGNVLDGLLNKAGLGNITHQTSGPNSRMAKMNEENAAYLHAGNVGKSRNIREFDAEFNTRNGRDNNPEIDEDIGLPTASQGKGGGKGKGQYQKKMDRITSGKSGGGFNFEKYGKGRVKVSEGEIAALPFALSGPPLLLHADLIDMMKANKKAADDAEDKYSGGGGGGGIASLLGGMLPALGALLPGLISAALPFLIGGAVLALLIAAIAGNADVRNRERDALIAGSGKSQEEIYKATGGATDLESVKLALSKMKTKNAPKPEEIAKVINDMAILGGSNLTPETAKMTADIKNDNIDNQPWLDNKQFNIIRKGNDFYAVGGRGANTLIPPSAYEIIFDRASRAQSPFNSMDFKKKSGKDATPADYINETLTLRKNFMFEKGGLVKGDFNNAPVPIIAHDGERVLNKKDTDNLQLLMDNMNKTQNGGDNKELKASLAFQNDILKQILDATNKNNDLTKDNKPKEVTSTKAMVNSALKGDVA